MMYTFYWDWKACFFFFYLYTIYPSEYTLLSAYYRLEGKGLVEARPQLGYYISYPERHIPSLPDITHPSAVARDGDNDVLVGQVYATPGEPGNQPLLLGTPASELLA